MEHNLIEEFAEFLKSKGKAEEADSMLESYRGFNEKMESIKEELIKKETEDSQLETNGITLEDCTFMTIAILPNGDMHMVDINSDNIADAIAETGHFRVAEEPMGKAEIKTHLLGGTQSTDKTYLN